MELKKACNEFEGIFLNMLYKQMRSSVGGAGAIQKDPGHEMFQTMLDEKLVESAVNGRGAGVGLSQMLYRQLSRNKLSRNIDEIESSL